MVQSGNPRPFSSQYLSVGGAGAGVGSLALHRVSSRPLSWWACRVAAPTCCTRCCCCWPPPARSCAHAPRPRLSWIQSTLML
ncbi:unnamed protein product [Parnassius apollo]|uniref:(apollo) hypothetical protein n=1 Tax=Parnassius apollo TaxID=110799 RepID=A0A8S3XE65_PARAO|nr:unnamed protein product [Parnassius apollo]